MANMNQVEMVDTKVTDGGLAQVFQIAQLHQLMVEKFAKEEVTNLSDFVSYWTKADYEKEAVEFRDEIEDLKKEKKRVDVARLRTAIVLARAVLEKPATPSESQSLAVDMEAPLTAKEKESIAAAWTSRYNMVLSMWLDPADSLVSRLYREFRQNTPQVIPVTKIRSVYTDSNPHPERKVPLAGGLMVTVEGRGRDEVVRDVASYYFALRILGNASAKAGNYEFDSKVEKGVKVIFAPLDTNLEYADHAFRMTLRQSGSASQKIGRAHV